MTALGLPAAVRRTRDDEELTSDNGEAERRTI